LVVKTITVDIGHRPTDVVVAANGRTAYVANSQENTVSTIDTSTDVVTSTMPAGSLPIKIATLRRCSASNGDTTIAVIGSSLVVVPKVSVGRYPFGAVGSPKASTAYVVSSQDDAVSALSTATNKIVSLFYAGANPQFASVGP
jgi:YVTN family beta-propeller protein